MGEALFYHSKEKLLNRSFNVHDTYSLHTFPDTPNPPANQCFKIRANEIHIDLELLLLLVGFDQNLLPSVELCEPHNSTVNMFTILIRPDSGY